MIRKIIGIGFILIVVLNTSICAQSDTAAVQMENIVISGSKFAEKKKNIIQKIDIITQKEIARTNAQNMGDLLMSTGNVFVQKSQQGGSSPVIRGFEASRVLLVIDGVRMNNAIYRSGHLQNVITVDQNILERVEILQGPSSTLYGSDALGGAVHMMTRQPKLATDGKKTHIFSNALIRYSSANSEKTIHADVNIGKKRWGFLTSVTQSEFGDMKMGKNDMRGFEGFGTRPFYVKPYNGTQGDTIVRNSNDRIQRFSGYSQVDVLQKIIFKANDKNTHGLNFQISNSSDIPRYDRLQDLRNNRLRFASWYYGPQKRKLLSYQFNHQNGTGFFQEYNLVTSYQEIEESRITREYKRYDQLDKRLELVKVGGLTLDARRKSKQDEFVTGIDFQVNSVKSIGERTNMLTQQISSLDSRYPNGKNHMNFAAVYVQHIHKFTNTKWVLNEGIRLQYSNLFSTIADNSFFQLPVTRVIQNNTAVTGNIGLVYNIENTTRIRFGYANGFRVPNIDDLSKIFETSTSANQVAVPNPNLKPEYTHNLDAGINKQLTPFLSVELTAYHTRFNQAIIKAPFQLNGKDSIMYYNVNTQVLANQNINRAKLFGGSIELKSKWGKYWQAHANVNLVRGYFLTDPTKPIPIYRKQTDGSYALVKEIVKTKPLDHIPPSFGKLSLTYDNSKWFAEAFVIYNGWKRLDDYNPDGEDNAQYATPQGTPAWQTVNMRFSYTWNTYWQIQLGIENIADLNYRYFGSGFSAAGRNISLSLRGRF